MKIGGVPITPPVEEVLVLPRGDAQLVFRAVAVRDWDEFHRLCPLPEPPSMLVKDKQVEDREAPGYKSAMAAYERKMSAYLFIKSLAPSNIEWDKVDECDPSTWERAEDDLRAAGLLELEIQKVFDIVTDANCLNERKLKAAREAFQRGQVQE